MSGADRPWETGDEPERWAGYLDPNTGLLRTLAVPPLTSAGELREFEDGHVERRLIRLRVEPIVGDFDRAHVQAIHRHLFQDVYPWAGELRTVNITKGEKQLPDGTMGPAPFLPYQHIGIVVDGMATQLREENYLRGLSNEQFADRLAVHFNDLNEAHPFREGNGRTQRAFWDQLAGQAGHVIHWQAVPAELNIRISHEARLGNLEPLRSTLRAIVSDTNTEALQLKATEAARLAAMDTPTRPGAAPAAGYQMPDALGSVYRPRGEPGASPGLGR